MNKHQQEESKIRIFKNGGFEFLGDGEEDKVLRLSNDFKRDWNESFENNYPNLTKILVGMTCVVICAAILVGYLLLKALNII